MKILAVLESCAIVEENDGTVTYRANAAVDADGTGSSHGDPDFQNATSLQFDGKSLNSDVDQYIVVPPVIPNSVKGIVLGCQAIVINLRNGRSINAVVADIGPRKRLGELSIASAVALGLNPSPTRGGEDENVIDYTISPGVAAFVHGKQYKLQPYHSS